MSIVQGNIMRRRLNCVPFASAILVSMPATCGADVVSTIETMPPAPPLTNAGTTSGTGTLKLDVRSKDPSQPSRPETIQFNRTSAYAYAARVGDQQTTWIVVADQKLDSVALDAADNRDGILQRTRADNATCDRHGRCFQHPADQP